MQYCVILATARSLTIIWISQDSPSKKPSPKSFFRNLAKIALLSAVTIVFRVACVSCEPSGQARDKPGQESESKAVSVDIIEVRLRQVFDGSSGRICEVRPLRHHFPIC